MPTYTLPGFKTAYDGATYAGRTQIVFTASAGAAFSYDYETLLRPDLFDAAQITDNSPSHIQTSLGDIGDGLWYVYRLTFDDGSRAVMLEVDEGAESHHFLLKSSKALPRSVGGFEKFMDSVVASTRIDKGIFAPAKPIDFEDFASIKLTDDDSYNGTTGKDFFAGGVGADVIRGHGGADIFYGGSGADRIHGGSGSDSLFGDADDDVLVGGAGNDILTGGAGNDRFVVVGDQFGSDVIADFDVAEDILKLSSLPVSYATAAALREGYDTLAEKFFDAYVGQQGDDVLINLGPSQILLQNVDMAFLELALDLSFVGLSFANERWGTDVADYISGRFGGDDLVFALDGNDRISGRSGDDFIYGDGGNDFLQGEQGNDLLVGGAGDDRLQGGMGSDLLVGGAGSDVFVLKIGYYRRFDNDVIIDFEDDVDQIILDNNYGNFGGIKGLTADQVLAKFATQVGSDVKIQFKGYFEIIVENVLVAQLADDLVLA